MLGSRLNLHLRLEDTRSYSDVSWLGLDLGAVHSLSEITGHFVCFFLFHWQNSGFYEFLSLDFRIIPIFLVHRPANNIPYATVEEELVGEFVKYSVRDGKEVNFLRRDSEAGQKCCTFQHWVYERTSGSLLVTDLQGELSGWGQLNGFPWYRLVTTQSIPAAAERPDCYFWAMFSWLSVSCWQCWATL